MANDFKEKPKFDEYGMTQWYWLARHKENLKLGKRVQIGNFTVLGCEHGIEIEDNVKIGYSCVIMTHSTVDNKMGKVIMRKGSRIGANSTVMPSITIGENAVVGANSFVNKDIPANEVWAGSPVKFIKKISNI